MGKSSPKRCHWGCQPLLTHGPHVLFAALGAFLQITHHSPHRSCPFDCCHIHLAVQVIFRPHLVGQ